MLTPSSGLIDLYQCFGINLWREFVYKSFWSVVYIKKDGFLVAEWLLALYYNLYQYKYDLQ
jgi:hypothetical protein